MKNDKKQHFDEMGDKVLNNNGNGNFTDIYRAILVSGTTPGLHRKAFIQAGLIPFENRDIEGCK